VATPFPDAAKLTRTLTTMWAKDGRGGAVAVLRRTRNPYASTFPSEIVTCRLPGGEVRRLLCKYAGTRDRAHLAHGHRHGVAYEAEVYRRVLVPLRAGTPGFFGSHGRGPGRVCLALDYLSDAERLEHAAAAAPLAARWAGQFHRASAALAPAVGLTCYGPTYYGGWVRRFRRFARVLQRREPWLAALCDRFAEVSAVLSAAPVVIHGEFYPKNILVHDGAVFPIDWESAAVAPGEIDLASLTEGWPQETVGECVRAYQEARWPAGAPPAFDRTLDAARVYLAFRWLGDRPEWLVLKKTRGLFAQLRGAGTRLGLI
jgi:hypothetical protein